MKLSIRFTNVIGACAFASGLVGYMTTTIRLEGNMIREAIYSQTPGFSKEILSDMAKLDKENLELLKSFFVQTIVGAGLMCLGERKD
jgi:hypothetical protein